MKLLVLSDSHSALSFMRACMDAVKPDGVIHLGDHYDDGCAIREEYPGLRFWQVPGNCDRYRTPPHVQDILIDRIGGVDVYMTHGHKHRVKSGTGMLLSAAHVAKANIVLYGHTHSAECYQEETGMWVMNPGSCGYYGGTAGLVVIENGRIQDCRILRQSELEEFV